MFKKNIILLLISLSLIFNIQIGFTHDIEHYYHHGETHESHHDETHDDHHGETHGSHHGETHENESNCDECFLYNHLAETTGLDQEPPSFVFLESIFFDKYLFKNIFALKFVAYQSRAP